MEIVENSPCLTKALGAIVARVPAQSPLAFPVRESEIPLGKIYEFAMYLM